MHQSLIYGDTQIPYQTVLNHDLTEKVRIHVYPSGFVQVEIPEHESHDAVIRKALRKRARWILKQVQAADKLRAHSLPREYVSGETHFYLGKRYRLKIISKKDNETTVKLKGGYIKITTPNREIDTIRESLFAWYKVRAKDYFTRRLNHTVRGISWLKQAPPLKLVTMRKQWGSCSPKGVIHLNPWLIRASTDCIDYVIIHEICHLKERNHSNKFYSLLEKHSPYWRQTKTRLDSMAELFLAT